MVNQIVYFGRSIPWVIVDAIPYFRRWKLQPNKIPSPEEQWDCVKQVLWAHITVELPTVRKNLLHARENPPQYFLDLAFSSNGRIRWNEDVPCPFSFAVNHGLANSLLHVL